MNYFDPYPLCVDDTVTTAWKTQLAEAGNTPWLARTLAERATELFPRFVTAYKELCALPRAARRSLQRRLARSRDVLGRAPEWLQRKEGRRVRYQLARSLTGAALLLALAQSAQAATITVTTNKPGINDSDGQCSLIEAIVNANNDAATHLDCPAGSGADTIVLPAGSTHALTRPYVYYHGNIGLPVVSSQITIQGNSSKITRPKSATRNRLIAVNSAGDLTLDSLTLSNGVEFDGGAVYNRGTLTIINSTITGNRAVSVGGGIYNYVGTVAIENSTITGNRASGGGGLEIRGGTLNMEYCNLTKNAASSHAGGMWIADTLLSSAVVTIRNSTIASNRSRYSSGGILHQNSGGTLTIQNSSIFGNRSGVDGGGIEQTSGRLVIESSTISGNGSKSGGGVWNAQPLTITNSTISNNKAKIGGGVYNWRNSLTLERSLISGNRAIIGSEIYNFASNGATITANDFNLFGASGNSGVTGFAPGASDIVPGVPVTSILATLANNGGPTMTHALAPGSPAIDAIPGADPECTGTDQRDTPRPQGAGCDIGAFEK